MDEQVKADEPKKAKLADIKMVKVRVLRPFELNGKIVSKGIVDVPAEMSEELCRRIDGPYSFFGERMQQHGETHRANLARAELVSA